MKEDHGDVCVWKLVMEIGKGWTSNLLDTGMAKCFSLDGWQQNLRGTLEHFKAKACDSIALPCFFFLQSSTAFAIAGKPECQTWAGMVKS